MRIPLACAAVLVFSLSFPVGPATGKDKEKLTVTPGDKQGDVEVLTCAPKGRALFFLPPGLDAAKKPGLLVTLHGHGSKADNMVLREFGTRRKWAVLSVEGRGDVQTPQGVGHQWDGTDAAYIAGVTKWAVQNRDIDPAQVVVFGHSAGGTMSLLAQAEDPSVFAGVITCSAPQVPDKRNEAARVMVFLGTQDPNFAGAKSVQNMLKKDAGHLALAEMEGAEHNDIPTIPYLDLAVDWCLAKGAVGRDIHVPKKNPEEPAAGFRHVLVRFKGAAGAPTAVKRGREAAKAACDDLLKRVRAGKALFSHEAQSMSEDDASAPIGGAIAAERLAEFGGALAGVQDAAAGADRFAGPFESPAGFHVLERVP